MLTGQFLACARMEVHIDPTAQEAARTAALTIAREIKAAHGVTTLGLAGGSTPKTAYWLLRQLDLDWSGVTCWLPDERYVPHNDPESNTSMARHELTDAVGARLLAPDTSLSDPALSAARYESELADAFGTTGPDIVLLGMGDDGHTASLFPGTSALEITRPGYVANHVPAMDTWRLTATMPLLWEASLLVFLVTGAAKANMVGKVLGDAELRPARLVTDGAAGDVLWLLDTAAATLLT